VSSVVVSHLAEQQHLLPTLQAWFESEWPAYYCAGGRGNAKRDLLAYANRGSVPVGLIAFRQGEPCGFAALKREAFPSHPHLVPWAGAAYVKPSMRRQGVGRCLLVALESEARALGYSRIYCATGTSASLLERCDWQLLEHVQHEGGQVGIYEKAL
jgi:GNAT superfamily N-acetyltransferase